MSFQLKTYKLVEDLYSETITSYSANEKQPKVKVQIYYVVYYFTYCK